MPDWLIGLVAYIPAAVLTWLGIQALRVIYNRDERVVQQAEFWRAFRNLMLILVALISMGVLVVFDC